MNTIRYCFSKSEDLLMRRWTGGQLQDGRIRYYSKFTNFYKNFNFILEHFLNRTICLDKRVCFERNSHNPYKYSEIYRTPRSFMFTNGPNQVMNIHQENSDASHYEKKLAADINKLIEIPHLSDSEANDLIRVFMSSIGNSFLSYYQWHLSEAQNLAKENKEIIRQARPFLRLYGRKLENFLTGTFEDFDEWDDVCFRRTYIEAFNAMFGEIISIDVEDIEECMQQRKEDVSLSSSALIPPNTPKSHWWWWN